MRAQADARVCVHGLVAAAQHNGVLGKVVNYNDEGGRYDVEYLNDVDMMSVLRVKRENAIVVVPLDSGSSA